MACIAIYVKKALIWKFTDHGNSPVFPLVGGGSVINGANTV